MCADVPRVLAIGAGLSDEQFVQALRAFALHVVLVGWPEACDRLAGGETPNAVLFLEFPLDEDGAARPDGVDCAIERIRAHPGLESIPVIFCSEEEGRDLALVEVAALLSSVAVDDSRARRGESKGVAARSHVYRP